MSDNRRCRGYAAPEHRESVRGELTRFQRMGVDPCARSGYPAGLLARKWSRGPSRESTAGSNEAGRDPCAPPDVRCGRTMAEEAAGRRAESSHGGRRGPGSPGETRWRGAGESLTTALVVCASLAVAARGQPLLEVDGIELHGNARLVVAGGGTCNVLEADTSYEARKANHGAPMDIWRLDFTVRNGSGRWLDHLIARYRIESAWPECTNWEGPDAAGQPIEWSGSAGHIQESGRHVVAPGQALTETKYFIVLRGDPEPRFANWSMDFDSRPASCLRRSRRICTCARRSRRCGRATRRRPARRWSGWRRCRPSTDWSRRRRSTTAPRRRGRRRASRSGPWRRRCGTCSWGPGKRSTTRRRWI